MDIKNIEWSHVLSFVLICNGVSSVKEQWSAEEEIFCFPKTESIHGK